MDRRARTAFLVLILVQALHSSEEYVFRLYDVLAPARYVSGLIGLDRQAGFAAVNGLLVLFGLWCALWPVRKGWRAGRPLAWGWSLVEIANGFGHLGLAAAAGGYFPGLYTAPLLILAGVWLVFAPSRPRPA